MVEPPNDGDLASIASFLGSAGVRYDPKRARANKPTAKEVIVIAIGSHSMRFGFANAPVPRKLRSIAAFRRKPDTGTDPICALGSIRLADVTSDESDYAAEFDTAVEQIAEDQALHERRRGGGKPNPWQVDVESVDVPDQPEDDASADKFSDDRPVLVGRAAERLLSASNVRRDDYDIVAPVADGRMAWDSHCSSNFVRAGLDAIFRAIGIELLGSPKDEVANQIPPSAGAGNEKKPPPVDASTNIALIVPDSADRADIGEYIAAAYRVDELRAAAIFVHHNSVSSALGAGLSTCVVLDIGWSSTCISCVEEGCVQADSRVHLQYGTQTILAAFERLIRRSFKNPKNSSGADTLENLVAGDVVDDDLQLLISRTCEQVCGFNTDENDTLAIVMSRAPNSGKMYRVKCGVGVRSVPAYGLVYPSLLNATSGLADLRLTRCPRQTIDRNTYEDNFMTGLFDDIKRSATVAAAVPFGRFANESPEQLNEESPAHPVRASVADALVWSVSRAVECSVLTQADSHRGAELKRRYFNSVLLAGGGSSIDGIALGLEKQIQRALGRMNSGVSDVTIIDGAKGKGDEELQAAAALVRDKGAAGLDDDGDPACLPWKGGAVMVEADAVNELWVYRDEWEARGFRAFRERVPFYW